MNMRIVIALGGNALGKNLHEQMAAATRAASAIAELALEGHSIVISHGNGPQVGMMELAMESYKKANSGADDVPLSVCVAMSQGYVGYDLQNSLRRELLKRGMDKSVASVITQVTVDPQDEAFKRPTKPIGGFVDKSAAEELQKQGIAVAEDAGRGYRRVVASPRPIGIVEIDSIRTLMDAGHIAIAAGGGGIPVAHREGFLLKGMPAVIDKDMTASLMARELDADMLVILTAVEKVALDFGKPTQRFLDKMSAHEARVYAAGGQFAPGSMLPKVLAAAEFAESGRERRSLITLLERATDGINGQNGTIIY